MLDANAESSKHGGSPQQELPEADTASIAEWFMRYVEGFQALDLHAAFRYVHVPFVFFDQRGMRVLSSESEVKALLALVMRDLASRGYARSEIDALHVHRMSNHFALVSSSRTRYTADGDKMEQLGETYTLMRSAGDEWQIAAAVVHDAERVVRARQARDRS
jgi:ketosteroid isomerase-like protein